MKIISGSTGMKKYKIEHSLDSPERSVIHGQIIRNKVFLRKLYEEWYSIFLEEMKSLPDGLLVELGSGGGFLKELAPRVICSDVIDLPTNDMTFSALEMPFEDNSVAGIFMIDTMHHIPDSEKFLEEASRILKKGGKILMIEPANSLWGRFIYKNFHHEPFNPKGDWTIPSSGPLSGANGALPWIVFIRDKEKFKNKFHRLTIESCRYINPLTYLFSGGVSRSQLFPNASYSVIKLVDKWLPRISPEISMFMVLKIKYE
jgi:SAM-dependent methyltransferase